MLRILKLTGWLLLIGLAGCATLTSPSVSPTSQASPLASPLTTPTPNNWLVRYHRSGGFAGFDETWFIYSDGRVEHVGKGSGRSIQLTSDQITALVGALRTTGFMALKDSYVPKNQCCDRFLHEITVSLDGQQKTVQTLDAAPDEPPALTNLISLLNGLLTQPPAS